ncbi:MAG TPA: D-glycero-beta-D-manno-heptose-7-phosphate kinase, partial [Dongiaceae bacterium]|nr:D-glycero-beta-D-manno-heptose-7-phosphate kinase [Dongiaceae bacterium]
MNRPTDPGSRLARERIEALLDKMRRCRVVVVGDAMLDIYLTGDTDRISPEAPVPVVTVRARRHALGGAANVAANVAAVGGEARLVAVVGDDPRGDSLRGELAAHRLPDGYLVTAPARPTTSKTRIMARGQQVVRIDEEVDDPVAERTEQLVMAELDRALADADALLIEDYNKGVLTPAVIECALDLARKRGLPVVVDPKFRNFFAYRGATVFKPNRRELEQAMGAALDLDAPDALPTVLERLQVDNLLLTLGGQGMVLFTKDRETARIPAMAREVFDVSGAGDTVTAWLGTALAAGARVLEAAQLANYAAGVEVGKSGVATASPAEVLAVHDAYQDQVGR